MGKEIFFDKKCKETLSITNLYQEILSDIN